MPKRSLAKSKETVVLEGASHVPMLSQPKAVAEIIEQRRGFRRDVSGERTRNPSVRK